MESKSESKAAITAVPPSSSSVQVQASKTPFGSRTNVQINLPANNVNKNSTEPNNLRSNFLQVPGNPAPPVRNSRHTARKHGQSSRQHKSSRNNPENRSNSKSTNKNRPKPPSTCRTMEEINIDADEDENLAVIIEEPLSDRENEAVVRELFRPTCNVAVVPPRGTAFLAPCLYLPCPRVCYPGCEDENDGVNFSFYPRADHATALTFCCQPRKKPTWHTMMRCGFVPIINSAVPPATGAAEANSRNQGSATSDSDSSGSGDHNTTSGSSCTSDDDSSDSEVESRAKHRSAKNSRNNSGKGKLRKPEFPGDGRGQRSSKGSKSSATATSRTGSSKPSSTRIIPVPYPSKQPQKSILKKTKKPNMTSSGSSSFYRG